MSDTPPSGWRALGRRWPVRVLRDALIVLALVIAVGAFQTRDLPSGPAPLFTLKSLSGELVKSESLAGRPGVLVFWAPWCGVCKAESQNVSWLQSLVGDRARVLSIASQYNALAEVKAYVAERQVDYPVLLGGRAAARSFDVKAYPTLFFLNARGEIKHAAVGYTTMFGLLWRLWL